MDTDELQIGEHMGQICYGARIPGNGMKNNQLIWDRYP